MYSQEDVEDILDGLRGCVVTNLRQEVRGNNDRRSISFNQIEIEEAFRGGGGHTNDNRSTVATDTLVALSYFSTVA